MANNNGSNSGIEKIPQAHGGSLNSGGTPGNKGNPEPVGRATNHVKARFKNRGLTPLHDIKLIPLFC